jgi:hypothetical protein
MVELIGWSAKEYFQQTWLVTLLACFAKTAGHWLGEADFWYRPFKLLVERHRRRENLRAAPRSLHNFGGIISLRTPIFGSEWWPILDEIHDRPLD